MGELSPPLSAKITLARSGSGLLRQAARASAACSCPRHAVESSLADCADCAGPVSCATVAAVPRRGPGLDCAAIHSDGGPGAGCGDVCCDGACVLRFRCWFAHYPCSELRKPCITPTKLPNKRLTYTALWAPPGVDHCATWLEPTALLLLMRRYGYPMRVIETVLSQYTPRLILFMGLLGRPRPLIGRYSYGLRTAVVALPAVAGRRRPAASEAL